MVIKWLASVSDEAQNASRSRPATYKKSFFAARFRPDSCRSHLADA
jgi:hypothetical protein